MTDDIYDSMIYFWASWGLLYACWNTINMSGTTEFYVNLGTWYHLNPTETYWNHQPRNDGVNMCELPLRIKHWIFSWTTLIEISKIWLVKIGVAAKPLTSGSFLVLNHQRLGEQKKTSKFKVHLFAHHLGWTLHGIKWYQMQYRHNFWLVYMAGLRYPAEKSLSTSPKQVVCFPKDEHVSKQLVQHTHFNHLYIYRYLYRYYIEIIYKSQTCFSFADCGPFFILPAVADGLGGPASMACVVDDIRNTWIYIYIYKQNMLEESDFMWKCWFRVSFPCDFMFVCFFFMRFCCVYLM